MVYIREKECDFAMQQQEPTTFAFCPLQLLILCNKKERDQSGEHGGKLVAHHDWVSPGTHVPILWLPGQCLAGAVSVVVFAIFKKGLQTSQHNADGEPVVGAGLVA